MTIDNRAIDDALMLVSALSECCFFALLVYKRIWKSLPLFTLYIAWAFVSDVAFFLIASHAPTRPPSPTPWSRPSTRCCNTVCSLS